MNRQVHPTMLAVLERFVPPAAATKPPAVVDPLLRYIDWKAANLSRALAIEAAWRADHGPAQMEAMLDDDAEALRRLRDDFLRYADDVLGW